MEEGITLDTQCVSEERDVQLDGSIDSERSCILTSYANLSYGIIMKQLTLFLAQLSAHAEGMFIISFAHSLHIWQVEVAHVIADESLESYLCPLTESFEGSDGKGVFQFPVASFVVDGVACQSACIEILVEIVIGGSLICLVDTLECIKFQSVDETGDWHVLILEEEGVLGCFLLLCQKTVGCCLSVHCETSGVSLHHILVGFKGRFVSCNLGIVRTTHVFVLIRLVEGFLIKFLSFFLGLLHGFFLGIALGVVFGRFHGKLLCLDFFLGHAYFALETETIAMREEDVLVIISVPVFFEHGRNFALCETLLEEVWMLDIVIVGDTSILRYLLVERGEEEVCLILVT